MVNYQLNQPYNHTWLGCNPGHLVLPAETVDEESSRKIAVLETGVSFSLRTQDYGDPQFITEVSNCQPLKIAANLNEWEYTQKGRAQEIVPFLFLGPMAVARDVKFVESNGITMLLAIRDGRGAITNPKIMNPALWKSGQNIEATTFDVMNEADLIRRFRLVIKKMNDHLMSKTERRPVTQFDQIGGKIMVFCEAGDTRSAAVVVLYFMVVFGLSARSAIQAVQTRRFGINVNGEMSRMIHSFEDIMQAERAVAASTVHHSGLSVIPNKRLQKRGIEESGDELEDSETALDYHDESYRAGVAPFTDMEF